MFYRKEIKLKVHNLYSGSWHSNTYVLLSEDSEGKKHAAVVDPSTDADEIAYFISARGAILDKIILTHGHFDHMLTLDDLRDLTDAPVYIHRSDAENMCDGEKNAYSFFFTEDWTVRSTDYTFDDGDIIKLGDETLKVIHLPGHTNGSSVFLADGFMLTGDTLFSYGFGRYDLYGGNAITLRNSLKKLLNYDKELLIYPGHGDSIRLGQALDNISYFLN